MREKRLGQEFDPADPANDVSTGQPLWFYRLSRVGKLAELKRRAELSGAEYVRDVSRSGLLPSGEVDPEYMERAVRRERKHRETVEGRREEARRRMREARMKEVAGG